MSDELSFSKIIAEDSILSITPPHEHLARIEFIARALAHGCIKNYWSPKLYVRVKDTGDIVETDEYGGIINRGYYGEFWESSGHLDFRLRLDEYLKLKWDNLFPHSDFMLALKYFEHTGTANDSMGYFNEYVLSPKAFALLETPIHSKVFISYRRAESSAFALLLHDRLRAQGFDPFIDKQLVLGVDWEIQLKKEVESCDVFIALISLNTLKKSEWVTREIKCAMDSEKPCIPIWHNGYEYKEGSIDDPDIEEFVSKKHGQPVKSEDILGYENTITSLLQFLKSPQ